MDKRARFVPSKIAELARLQNILGSVFLDEVPDFVEVDAFSKQREAQPEGWPESHSSALAPVDS